MGWQDRATSGRVEAGWRADTDRTTDSDRRAAYRKAVLGVVASIPPGRVMAYSAIADYLADAWRLRAPRLIGRIMATTDGPVPWHRVVQRDGAPARGHEVEALRRLRGDGTPLRGNRVDMWRAAWAPETPPPRP